MFSGKVDPMTELATALRELADRPQPAGGTDAADLWQRGRRRVHRRRAIAAGIAAVALAVVGIGTLVVPEPVVVMPAGEVHTPGFPERLYSPSKWLASTDDQGPLGQLALVSTAGRGSRLGVFGVSATTGEYRFLDLPGWVEGSPTSLAPDGKHVAYWTTGRTLKAPYPDPELEGLGADQAIAGMAIYDTVSGAVQRTKLLTTHGMRGQQLFWIDSATVYFGDWQLKTRTGSSRSQFLAVSVGEPKARYVDVTTAAMIDGYRNADGSILAPREDALADGLTWDNSRGQAPGAGGSPSVRLPAKLPEKYATGGTVSYGYVARAGTRVVVTVDAAGRLSNPVLVGDIDWDGMVARLRVAGHGFENARVLGWHDDHTLLAYGTDRNVGILASIDVRDGAVTTISRDRRGWATDLSPATDVLRGELVPGREPPTPMDPRLRNGLVVAGGLALAGGALWLARRRRRA